MRLFPFSVGKGPVSASAADTGPAGGRHRSRPVRPISSRSVTKTVTPGGWTFIKGSVIPRSRAPPVPAAAIRSAVPLSKRTERLLSHPFFLRDLSRALVFGEDHPGPYTPEAWNAALRRGPVRKGRFGRRLRRRFTKKAAASCPEFHGPRLVESVLALEEPFASILVRHFYSGVTVERAAEFYARSEKWARALLRKSLERLRRRLDELCGQDRRRWCDALQSWAELEPEEER